MVCFMANLATNFCLKLIFTKSIRNAQEILLVGYLFNFSISKYVEIRCSNFFSLSDQRPDLAIQDLRNFFVEKSSDPRPLNIVLI